MAALMAEYRLTVVGLLMMLVFFLWMDVAFYFKNQSSRPIHPSTALIPSDSSYPRRDPNYTPVRLVSIKEIMLDQTNSYIFSPLAEKFDEVTGFSRTFTFVSANAVSTLGIFCACISGRLMVFDNFAMHRLAILFFQFRTFFDALDGVVARAHKSAKEPLISGFVADGLADTIGFLAFLIGCYIFLRRNQPKLRYGQYLPRQVQDSFGEQSSSTSTKFGISISSSFVSQYVPQQLFKSSKQVFFVVACFAVQLVLGSFFWLRYTGAYHQLLETPVQSLDKAGLQNEVLSSSMTWVIIWLWKVSNAHSFMQLLLLAAFLNRLWDFLNWIQYIGFVQILTLAFFTEIHLSDVESYLTRK